MHINHHTLYTTHLTHHPLDPPPTRRRQQNGLKNLSAAKHLRHVFNNVVYNVDAFSLFFFVVLLLLFICLWMNFYRMPFMAFWGRHSRIAETNAVKSVLFQSFSLANYEKTIYGC